MAIRPPDDVRALLAEAARRTLAACPAARVYGAADLHLTLAFLGELEAAAIEALARELDALCPLVAPFDVVVSRSGAFPARGRERVLWAGLEPSDALSELWGTVDRALERAGVRTRDAPIAAERVPHITLARIPPDAAQSRGAVPELFFDLRFDLPWNVREVLVCASQARSLSSERYLTLHVARLRGVADR